MKKIYQIIMLYAMSIALASCVGNADKSSSENEKKNAELEQEYREACENKEFAKAYGAVAELRDIYTKASTQCPSESEGKVSFEEYANFEIGVQNAHDNYLNAEKYVVIQEALTALETNGKNGLGRVAIIAKEHPMHGNCFFCGDKIDREHRWLYNTLLEYATSADDEELQEKIQNIIDKKTKPTETE